ncbi:hypothetical protein, partial [Streptomyces coelicoflavus]
ALGLGTLSACSSDSSAAGNTDKFDVVVVPCPGLRNASTRAYRGRIAPVVSLVGASATGGQDSDH